MMISPPAPGVVEEKKKNRAVFQNNLLLSLFFLLSGRGDDGVVCLSVFAILERVGGGV